MKLSDIRNHYNATIVDLETGTILGHVDRVVLLSGRRCIIDSMDEEDILAYAEHHGRPLFGQED